MNYLELEETPSTNTYATQHAGELADMTMVTARRQSAGRGQRGNSWESEPGRNLTFSLFFRPPRSLHPRSQFFISEAVALAIADALAGRGVEAMVKWPNDIYCGDRKICGILIEHSLFGDHIRHTVAGAGINVNQREFRSDAPNPVSMVQLLGHDTDLTALRAEVAEAIERRLSVLGGDTESLHREYLSRLWRGDGGMYPFRDVRAGEEIEATIEGVAPDGTLRLRLRDGSVRDYAFKEVEFRL